MSRKKILILFLGVLATLVFGTYLLVAWTGGHKGLAERILQGVLRDFRLRDAELDLGKGRFLLKRLLIPDPNRPRQDPLLAVEDVQVDIDTNPLGEVGAVRRVTLNKVSVNLSLAEMPDLSQIFKEAGLEGTGDQILPEINVTDSVIRLRLSPEQDPVEFTNVQARMLPVTNEPDLMELSGTMMSPLGYRVVIKGSGNVRKGEFRTIMEAGGIQITPKEAEAFSPEVARYIKDAKITGLIKKMAIWLELRAPDSNNSQANRFGGGISVDYENVEATPPRLPYHLEGAHGKVFASTSENGTLKFQLDKQGVDGDLQVVGKLTNCFSSPFQPLVNITVDAPGVLIGPKLERAVNQPRIPEAQRLWQAFAPKAGRVNGKIRVWNDKAGQALKTAADVTLVGVAASFEGYSVRHGRVSFPYPLNNIRGKIMVRPGLIKLVGFTADAGRGTVTLNGDLTLDGELQTSLDIRGKGLAFSKELRDALDALLDGGGVIYDEYSPRGNTDISVKLRAGKDDLKYSVVINPLAASLSYSGFPYRVNGIRGTVKITENGVQMSLDGNRNKSAITVNGKFHFGPRNGIRGLHSELWVKVTDVPADNELRKGLSVITGVANDAWALFSPRGTLNGEVTLWKEKQDASFDYDVHLQVREGSLMLEPIQIPLETVEGDVFIHGRGNSSRVDISSLRGTIKNGDGKEAPANVLLGGTGEIDGDKTSTDFTCVIRHLRLSRQIATSLDKAGVFDIATWDLLAMDGYVDGIGRLQKKKDQKEYDQTYRLRLRDISSSSTMLPGKASNMNGWVDVKGGKAEFKDIRFNIGTSPVQCTGGSITHDGKQSIVEFTLSAREFPIDDTLAQMMTEPARSSYLAAKISGAASITGLHFVFRFPDRGDDVQLRIDGQISAKNLRIGAGVPVHQINGVVIIKEARFDRRGAVVHGRITGANAMIEEHQMHRCKAEFTLTENSVELRNLGMNMHAGRIGGTGKNGVALRYDAAGKGNLQLHLRWNGISLSEFLRVGGLVTGHKYQGTLEGHLDINELRGWSVLSAKGKGELRITEGNLGQVPVFSTIYAYINPEKRPRFSSGRVRFTLDKVINLTMIRLRSTLLDLEGSGTIRPDGYMDITLRLPKIFGRDADILAITLPFNAVVSTIVKFHIYGYSRNPRAKPVFWGTSRGRRQRLTPVPTLNPNDLPIPKSEQRRRAYGAKPSAHKR